MTSNYLQRLNDYNGQVFQVCCLNMIMRNSWYLSQELRTLAFSHIVSLPIVIVISKLLKRYSKAKRTRAPAYSRALRRIKRGFPKGVKRSSGPNSRVPGGDRVAVRVGVVEMGRERCSMLIANLTDD